MFRRTSIFRVYTDCCRGRKLLEIPTHVSKIVCIARNFSDIASEREAPLDVRMKEAAIFLKPPSSISSIEPTINLNGYSDVICETELALLIGKGLPRMRGELSHAKIVESIAGIGLAFDLTRKDLQNQLKAQGKPWELAKGFDGACPISSFCEVSDGEWINENLDIQLYLNGELQLRQPIGHMILPVVDLIRTITRDMSLWPGDVILTGTPTKPKIPPRIQPGNEIVASIGDYIRVETVVV